MEKNILDDILFENIKNTSQEFTKHFHDTYTIGITSRGRFTSYHLDKNYTFYEKSIKVINPFEVHCGKSTDWNYVNFYPSIHLLSDIYEQVFFERCLPIFEKHIIENNELLYHKFYQFFYLAYYSQNAMQIETAMLEALSSLIKQYAGSQKKDTFFENHKKIKYSIDYINSMICNNITLNELAKTAGLSKYHFLRLFKKYTGLSPHQYIINQRINMYKNAIMNNKHSTIDAFELGFCDQSHLIRNFKRIYGYSPKQMKNSNFILYTQ